MRETKHMKILWWTYHFFHHTGYLRGMWNDFNLAFLYVIFTLVWTPQTHWSSDTFASLMKKSRVSDWDLTLALWSCCRKWHILIVSARMNSFDYIMIGKQFQKHIVFSGHAIHHSWNCMRLFRKKRSEKREGLSVLCPRELPILLDGWALGQQARQIDHIENLPHLTLSSSYYGMPCMFSVTLLQVNKQVVHACCAQ